MALSLIISRTRVKVWDIYIKRMITKAGQAWGIDLMIAAAVVMAGMTLIYLYSYQLASRGERQLDTMNAVSERLASTLLSAGAPENWNRDTVTSIGILTDSTINQTKLEEWHALTLADYNATKRIFRTNYEYFVNFTQPIIIDSNQVQGIGRAPTETKNLIKISRFSVYRNNPVTIKILIWN